MSVVAAAGDQQKAQKLQKVGYGGGHIGHGGGVEHLLRAAQLIFGKIAAAAQHGDGPLAGVKFHRQRHQRKHQRQGKADDAGVYQRLPAEQDAGHEDGEVQIAADVDHRHDGRAQLQGRIALVLLHGVTALVSRYADGGDAAVAQHILTEAQGVAGGIIMIRQGTGHAGDGHAAVAAAIEQIAGYILGACAPPAVNTAVLGKSGFDAKLRPQAQQKTGQNQKHRPVKVEQNGTSFITRQTKRQTAAVSIIHQSPAITTGNV